MPSKPDTETGKSSEALSDSAADQNVDKIRDILFGGQMRDYARRFETMERRIAAETERLARDMDKRLEGLEAFVRKELDMLSERLAQEKHERLKGRDALQGSLEQLRQETEAQFGEFDERVNAEMRTLRSDLHDQNVDLTGLVQQSREAVEARLEAESRELEDSKVAREDLAGLFSEVALRLKRDFDLPEGD